MKLARPTEIKTGVLIIGGGGAGLRAAIEARKAGVNVLIAAKHRVGYTCNTAIAGGGLAAATGWKDPQDNPVVHARDTIAGGRFINDQQLVEVMAQGSPQQVPELAKFGVTFLQTGDRIDLALAPGHSYHRHIRGEHSLGRQDYTLPLRHYALKIGVKFAEGVLVTHILRSDGMVSGAIGIDRQGGMFVFRAQAIILATGGAGQIYMNTDNAIGATGDGYALAYELGLPLQDMEFVQFFPSALGRLGKIIIYDSLFRLGATLRNSSGEEILKKYDLTDPLLMTRDNVSRAIFREILEGSDIQGGVVMDLTTIPPETRESAISRLPVGVSRDRQQFIVAPTCHFFMGGVKINQQGETGIEGLWAAGEVCSGVHGANRLGGNSFAEIFVFGAIAGKRAAAQVEKAASAYPAPANLNKALDELNSLAARQGKESDKQLLAEMKKTTWRHAGIIREEKGLKQSLEKLASLHKALSSVGIEDQRKLRRIFELHNMLLVSEMVCRAALTRTESRGSHFRSDFPQENSDWLRNICISHHGQVATAKLGNSK